MATNADQPADVYFARCELTGRIKIGASTSVENRITSLNNQNSGPVQLLGTIPSGGMALEKKLHEHFAEERVHREWFDPSQRLTRFIAQQSIINENDADDVWGFLLAFSGGST